MSTTIPDLWEAFLSAEDELLLKLQSYDACIHIKGALSTYKTRALKSNPELAAELGKFSLDFTMTQITEGKDKHKWLMYVGMRRSRAKPILDVEIVKAKEGEF
jgi:hypothetical protein